jgi:hypothetical protein
MMSDYTYSYEPDSKYKFKFYINHELVYSFEDCDPMTDKEAENFAEDLYIEWLDNTMSFRPNNFMSYL